MASPVKSSSDCRLAARLGMSLNVPEAALSDKLSQVVSAPSEDVYPLPKFATSA
jgi:hypothetical protein